MLHRDGKVGSYGFGNTYKTIAWMPLSELPAFTPIPDPPDGWRLVDQTKDVDDGRAMTLAADDNTWITRGFSGREWCEGNTYIIPIDPPEPQYRPFANAAEFEPYENRFWRYKDDIPTVRRSPQFYSDDGHFSDGWDYCFSRKQFGDGSPFGIQIK